MNQNSLIGLSESDAIKILNDNDIKYRVSSRNDRPCIVTMDFRPDRVNLHIRDGIITVITNG